MSKRTMHRVPLRSGTPLHHREDAASCLHVGSVRYERNKTPTKLVIINLYSDCYGKFSLLINALTAWNDFISTQ